MSDQGGAERRPLTEEERLIRQRLADLERMRRLLEEFLKWSKPRRRGEE